MIFIVFIANANDFKLREYSLRILSFKILLLLLYIHYIYITLRKNRLINICVSPDVYFNWSLILLDIIWNQKLIYHFHLKSKINSFVFYYKLVFCLNFSVFLSHWLCLKSAILLFRLILNLQILFCVKHFVNYIIFELGYCFELLAIDV